MIRRLPAFIVMLTALCACDSAAPSDATQVDPTPDPTTDPDRMAGSPFGIAPRGAEDHTQQVQRLLELGAQSVRLAGPAAVISEALERDNWDHLDRIYGGYTEAGVEISAVILGGNPAADGESALAAYAEFVRGAVERYDGDGIDDAPGSPRVTYWEIDNEPDLYGEAANERTPWHGELAEVDDYAQVLIAAHDAIKTADPTARVAIAGMAFSLDYYESILEALAARQRGPGAPAFDAFNFHYYSPHGAYGQRTTTINGQPPDDRANPGLPAVKEMLGRNGYGSCEIIVTETATYSGTPPGPFTSQSEQQQAASLFKRYVYLAAHGVSRVYWLGVDTLGPDRPGGEGDAVVGSLFDAMTLRSADAAKAAYYSFQLMTALLGEVDWNGAEILEQREGKLAFELPGADGKPRWVAWLDDGATATPSVSLAVGDPGTVRAIQAVPQATSPSDGLQSMFASQELPVQGGQVQLSLGDTPQVVTLTP